MQETYQRVPGNFAVTLGKRIRLPINRWLHRHSAIGSGPFFEESQVPGIELLRDNWEAIRAEAEALLANRASIPPLGRISPDHRRIATNSSWKSFFLSGYGFKIAANRARCPATSALLDRVPGVVVAFFSIFEPGTHIPKHRGMSKALLNVHLGLIVPTGQGRCEIRVGNETRRWRSGELMIFDETYDHEAWNLTNEPRVVLFLHVLRPMYWPGRLIGRLFLWAVSRTSIVQDARKALGAT